MDILNVAGNAPPMHGEERTERTLEAVCLLSDLEPFCLQYLVVLVSQELLHVSRQGPGVTWIVNVHQLLVVFFHAAPGVFFILQTGLRLEDRTI